MVSCARLILAVSKRHKGDELPRNGPRCLCKNLLLLLCWPNRVRRLVSCDVAGNREQAFVYALTGASLTHAVAKACSAGTSIRCGCGSMPRDQPDGDFRWGGCNDDVMFAAEFSRTFTDAGWSNKRKLSKRTMTNKHNYAAGRKVNLRLSSFFLWLTYFVQFF